MIDLKEISSTKEDPDRYEVDHVFRLYVISNAFNAQLERCE